jgi:hypothetical protein
MQDRTGFAGVLVVSAPPGDDPVEGYNLGRNGVLGGGFVGSRGNLVEYRGYRRFRDEDFRSQASLSHAPLSLEAQKDKPLVAMRDLRLVHRQLELEVLFEEHGKFCSELFRFGFGASTQHDTVVGIPEVDTVPLPPSPALDPFPSREVSLRLHVLVQFMQVTVG